MVRDLYEGARAARMLSILITVMSIAPLLGPLLGGQIPRRRAGGQSSGFLSRLALGRWFSSQLSRKPFRSEIEIATCLCGLS